MVATITITGRMGTAPTCHLTASGVDFTRFRVAHTPRIRRNDEWQDGETVWFTVRTYGQLARNAAALQRGNPVLVVGQWRVESWVDGNGVVRVDNVLIADAAGPDLQHCRVTVLPKISEQVVPDREPSSPVEAAAGPEMAGVEGAQGAQGEGDGAEAELAEGADAPAA